MHVQVTCSCLLNVQDKGVHIELINNLWVVCNIIQCFGGNVWFVWIAVATILWPNLQVIAVLTC